MKRLLHYPLEIGLCFSFIIFPSLAKPGAQVKLAHSSTTQSQVDANIYTVAGNGSRGYSGDGGPATDARFDTIDSVFVDGSGNLYISDIQNENVRKVDLSGTITTVAGDGTRGFSGDGSPAISARLHTPSSVCVDALANLYIADSGNHRIRKVDLSGTITTVAGDGTRGFSGDEGPATKASLNWPAGVCVDGSGNLYIADYYNQRVRKVDPSGTITTVAGNGTAGYSGDGGPAASARLNNPSAVYVDGSGNLYIADYYNQRVRKVDPSGTITTVAGNGSSGYSGDGGPATSARLNYPRDICVDGWGNLYIADVLNYRIRKVDSSGTITTVAGNGSRGFSDDGTPATSASLSTPWGVSVDRSGNVYIADWPSFRIRIISYRLAADAGPDQTTHVNHPVSPDATPSGGDGTYVFTWSILSGPDTDASQFSDTSLEDPTFTPSSEGTYVLELTVDDRIQAPVSDTVTITVTDSTSMPTPTPKATPTNTLRSREPGRPANIAATRDRPSMRHWKVRQVFPWMIGETFTLPI